MKRFKLILAAVAISQLSINAPHLHAANPELQSLRSKLDDANKKLNGVYQNLLAAFDQQIKNGHELDRTFAEDHKKALIEAEQAWTHWRDAEAVFQARFTGSVGGSALEEDVDTKLLEMTTQRTELLQKCFDQLKVNSPPPAAQNTTNKAAATTQKVETVSSSDIQSSAANFHGRIQWAYENDASKEALFQQYGKRTSEAFQKHPELVSSLKKLNPQFDPNGMGDRYLNSVASFNGRRLLILRGCVPGNCEETALAGVERSMVYLLQPTSSTSESGRTRRFNLYGNPDSLVRAAIYSAYRAYLQ